MISPVLRTLFAAASLIGLGMTLPAAAQTGTLFVENDRVGVDVATPSYKLHLSGATSDLRIHVDHTSGTDAARRLFQLVNNGNVQFGFRDTSQNADWEFDASDVLRINRGGSGVNEILLHPGGDLYIGGTLFESSDRATKQDIEPVDARRVLAQVSELPIATWVRKRNPAATHLGPMAQDFASIFGLGQDDTTIAVLDMAGVSLAAIQGLHLELEEKERELSGLRAENERLEQRLDRLERLLGVDSETTDVP